jgi:hypothetical protein
VAPAVVAAVAALAVSAITSCEAVVTTTVESSAPPPLVIVDSPSAVPGALTLTITGQPTRSFIISGGRWNVCDKGVVANAGTVVAHDVRVVATYVDKGVTVGSTTRADAAADGGALGELAPGQSHPFTFCAITRNEPDLDRLTATAG